MGLKVRIPYAVARGKPWWMWVDCMHFTFVAIMVVSVIISAVRWWIRDPGWMEIPLQQVATSDFVPLGVVVVFCCACVAIAFYTLWCVYSDNEGLELRDLEAQEPTPPTRVRRCGVPPHSLALAIAPVPMPRLPHSATPSIDPDAMVVAMSIERDAL